VGSGKTTTLHATLVEIADESLNVVTIEDPVEYVFPQFQQINVNDETGVSFLEGLRVTLRFDSNIILVGEIRDEETAQTALSAALTGHAVLTTTHARDATSAILRLSAMEIEAFLLANALKGVVAQRLVRRICDNCREPVELPSLERAFIEQFLPEKEGFTKGRGCEECKGTGYHGRLGVYEFLRMTPAIGKLISSSPNEDAIRATALAEGMITLEQGALALVHDDKTTPAEVLRGVFSK
jgi:type II secretory ATPase GspE/PulE/Tfp pilus assembly ATPase PilB-like protein